MFAWRGSGQLLARRAIGCSTRAVWSWISENEHRTLSTLTARCRTASGTRWGSKRPVRLEMIVERKGVRFPLDAKVSSVRIVGNDPSFDAEASGLSPSRIRGMSVVRCGVSFGPRAWERSSRSTRMWGCSRLVAQNCSTALRIGLAKASMREPTMRISLLSWESRNPSRTFESGAACVTLRKSGIVCGRKVTHLRPRDWKMNITAWMAVAWCSVSDGLFRMVSSAEIARVA
mmetsp:Transcript_8825/g.21722  ORF Transcript_8825/g.21722 Transcript_8825/m.21722 type:complete len:231 (-) Transcript_8825:609-1301(-)